MTVIEPLPSTPVVEPPQIPDDITSYLVLPDARGTFMRVLREATHNNSFRRRLCLNLAKACNKAPEILTLLLGLDWREPSLDNPETTTTTTTTTVASMSLSQVIQELLLHLASRQPNTVPLIVHSLVGRLSREGVVTTLASLMELLPSASTMILSSLSTRFPYHLRSNIEEHRSYVKAILDFTLRYPQWRPSLWELLVSRTLILDLEMQNYSRATQEDEVIKGQELTAKLDAIIMLLFEAVRNELELSPAAAEEMFTILLACFQRFILPTFKSRCLQFLVFYAASWSSEFCDQLLGILFRPLLKFVTALNDGKCIGYSPSVITTNSSSLFITSLAYIGSFVVRAKFVPHSMLRLVFDTLVELYKRLECSIRGESMAIIIAQQVWQLVLSRSSELIQSYEGGSEEWGDVIDGLLVNNRLMVLCDEQSKGLVERALYLVDEQLGLVDVDLVESYREYRRYQEVNDTNQSQRHRRNTGNNSKRAKVEASLENEKVLPFDPMPLEHSWSFITPQMYLLLDETLPCSPIDK